MIEEEKRHITKECCVEFLVQWIHNKGTEATVGKLKEALERIKLKDVAENLISGKQERDTEVSVFKMSIMSVSWQKDCRPISCKLSIFSYWCDLSSLTA